ncbi:YcjX family protein [Thalassotalea nanhaiensis]|uniref:YcjX family protein n=1 Tax=Thalassotalea nanhaiensis TaxID=3065648 RepID=A0ABY9TLN7_9GAMM|nr:YcjX family protein [Colwelliaceae bacterium SQ345]
MAIINKKTISNLKQRVKDSTKELFNRSLDQHINLAVTGLSQSGKTAFITSLVNQLVNEGNGKPLTFFNVVHEGRFIAAKRVPQSNLHISRFDYDGAMQNLGQDEPVWPVPTKNISELRLAIRYYPDQSLLKYAKEMATLYVDITDYPGEWLLDLPMLNQTFEEWSQYMGDLLLQEPRKELAADFLAKLKDVDPLGPVNEDLLAEFANEYTELLLKFRHEKGLSVIQPGRFILPGEHEGAPILQFVPYPFFNYVEKNEYQSAGQDTFIGMLRARYLEYRERIVREFYKKHFVKFDRQIVLADCLTPLTNGPLAFNDLQQAIALILESFAYGKANILTRLFSPKIDKLLFAATKADHVTGEQHANLTALLEQLVYKAKKALSFDAIKMKTLAIASVQTTQQGKSEYQGKSISVLKGKRLDTQKLITVYPGSVPAKLPSKEYWNEQGFKYIAFKPMNKIEDHEALPNIRLDQVLQFLLGDKLK